MDRINVPGFSAEEPVGTLAEVYLDGTSGSDDNDGVTALTAVATLAKAISLTDPAQGSTIWAEAATYSAEGLFGLDSLRDYGLSIRCTSPWEVIAGPFSTGASALANELVPGVSPGWAEDQFVTADGSGGGFIEITASSNASLVGLRRLIRAVEADRIHLATSLPVAPPTGTEFQVVRPPMVVNLDPGTVFYGLNDSSNQHLVFEGCRLVFTGDSIVETSRSITLFGCEIVLDTDHSFAQLSAEGILNFGGGPSDFLGLTGAEAFGYGVTFTSTVHSTTHFLARQAAQIYGSCVLSGFYTINFTAVGTLAGGRVHTISVGTTGTVYLGSSSFSGTPRSPVSIDGRLDMNGGSITLNTGLDFQGSSSNSTLDFNAQLIASSGSVSGFHNYSGALVLSTGSGVTGSTWIGDPDTTPGGGFILPGEDPKYALLLGESHIGAESTFLSRVGTYSSLTEVYLDAATGNDSSAGTSALTAVASLKRAITLTDLHQDSYIYAAAGIYDGVVLTKHRDRSARLHIECTSSWDVISGPFTLDTSTSVRLAITPDPGWATDQFLTNDGSQGGFVEVVSSSDSSLVGLRRMITYNDSAAIGLSGALPAVPPAGTTIRIVRPPMQIDLGDGDLIGGDPGGSPSSQLDSAGTDVLVMEGVRIQSSGRNRSIRGSVHLLGCELEGSDASGWSVGAGSVLYSGTGTFGNFDTDGSTLVPGPTGFGYGFTLSNTTNSVEALYISNRAIVKGSFVAKGQVSCQEGSVLNWHGGRAQDFLSSSASVEFGHQPPSGMQEAPIVLVPAGGSAVATLESCNVESDTSFDMRGSSLDFVIKNGSFVDLAAGFQNFAGTIEVMGSATLRCTGSWAAGPDVPAGGFVAGEITPSSQATLSSGDILTGGDGARIYNT